jgi:DNA replication and repair protein RecF
VRVRRLLLEDFRSYDVADIELAPGITAFVGPNGAGKTNVLEAIHLLARGYSSRARDDTELVRWGAAMARVAAEVEREEPRRVEVVLFAPPPGERRRPRRYLADGASKRADDVLGETVVVAFFPEDVELLAEAPSGRRRYIDAMIAQVDRRHRAEMREYQRVLEQRNALLRALREEWARYGPSVSDGPAPIEPEASQILLGGSEEAVVSRVPGSLRERQQKGPEAEMTFWDRELCRLAASLSLRRMHAVRELREPFREAVERASGERVVDVAYATPAEGETEADRSRAYRALLEEKRERERWQGATLVGPHREDLAVTAGGRDLPSFASRGEQRTVVLALKLAEAAWLRERTGTSPVFLLDDVLSELDPERRQRLIDAIPPDAQALVTTALPAGLPPALADRASVVPVERGRVGPPGRGTGAVTRGGPR